ncbi:MAG: metallophosphoesterase [Planctomycetes bacterium]|nr:metallophosphoesterase [Planctomycetota bacterium]
MKFTRRNVSILVVALLAVLLSPLRGPKPLRSGPYSQAVTSDSAVVRIVTRTPRELGLVAMRDARTIAEIGPSGPRTRHEFRLTGLEPAAVYDFDIVDADGGRRDHGSFRTRSDSDGDSVRFVVFGDSGGQPWWDFARNSPLFYDYDLQDRLAPASHPVAMGRAVAAERPDFWLHVGDVVYPRGQMKHYGTGFFRPFEELLRHATCYPVLGNHDVMVGDGEAFLENFCYPGKERRCFTFRDGPLRVIGVDMTEPETRPASPDHPSIKFLRETLERAEEPWIIVINHFPVLSAYRPAPRPDLVKYYVPLLEQYGVDLVFAGHDHNYQRFSGAVPQIDTGGGGKSLYEILQHPDGLVVAKEAYHYCSVRIEGPRLELRAIALDGRVLDDFVIDKTTKIEDGTAVGSPARLRRLRALGE